MNEKEIKIMIQVLAKKLDRPEHLEEPKNTMVARLEKDFTNLPSASAAKDSGLKKLDSLINLFLNRLKPDDRKEILENFKTEKIRQGKPLPIRPTKGAETTVQPAGSWTRKRSNAVLENKQTSQNVHDNASVTPGKGRRI
jgi:glutamate synthase domain-containing protein 3